ncbi:Alanine--glyoxylate aminotransferase 2-like protein 3, mitochondrial [Triticum urartu]|nr:Alanine--glyoxylate aminotransferase 2-like protein 3, mitochondrial [Triticum urartu]
MTPPRLANRLELPWRSAQSRFVLSLGTRWAVVMLGARRSFSRLAAAVRTPVDVPRMPAFDHVPLPYDGPSAVEIARKRAEFLSPSLFHFYSKPLNIVEGKKQYLYDEHGRRYLDAFAGIATVVFFTNSGTEANELAIMMARLYTGSHDIISLRNSYHGNASGTMGATAQKNWKFNVVQSGVHHAVNPDPYRGAFGPDGEKYARDVKEIIEFGTTGHVAGFISEAIQGVGGIVEVAPGYLPLAYDAVRKAGGLCIADEVQVGFARVGSHFWGFETHGVIPDIVTMAKGIGNGIPLGAVVTTPEIAQVLTRRSYFNTFGGNPLCTAGGLAVLKVLDRERLQENAFIVGAYLKDRLRGLQEKHQIIGDVRGAGFMLGVELVTDRQLKTPAKDEICQAMEHMKDMGVLVGKGGFYGNVFRITPPLCFTKEDADFFVDVMDIALSKL